MWIWNDLADICMFLWNKASNRLNFSFTWNPCQFTLNLLLYVFIWQYDAPSSNNGLMDVYHYTYSVKTYEKHNSITCMWIWNDLADICMFLWNKASNRLNFTFTWNLCQFTLNLLFYVSIWQYDTPSSNTGLIVVLHFTSSVKTYEKHNLITHMWIWDDFGRHLHVFAK
jgi:hypothetical protein